MLTKEAYTERIANTLTFSKNYKKLMQYSGKQSFMIMYVNSKGELIKSNITDTMV